MARTIESPGVEIKEIDLSFNTQLPYGTTSLVCGYAKQGPTDELINVTSKDELERIYGLPENAAERYMYQTASQILNANGNLLMTRLPYGSADGAGYTTKYSALVYPYLPVDVSNACTNEGYTLGTESIGDVLIHTLSSDMVSFEETIRSISPASALNAVCVSSMNTQISASFKFVSGASTVSAVFTFPISGGLGTTEDNLTDIPGLSANLFYAEFAETESALRDSLAGNYYNGLISAVNIPEGVVTTGTVSAGFIYYDSVTATRVTPDEASHYYIGEPVHITLDENTYLKWLQGGINWKSTLSQEATGLTKNTELSDIISNVGYGAMIIVNEAKTVVSDQFEGYYIAIADNTKIDKGTNFDSILNLKSFNQHSDPNEWVNVNKSSLGFSLTGSYFKHGGSVSEIVQSVPDFDFSNNDIGGFGDSLIVGLFKVRPSLYNQDERVLEKVLYEAHIGSLDKSRKIQNQAGGNPVNFYLEDIVNSSSKSLKVFVNPYISDFSGSWVDGATLKPTKFVRIISDERDIMGSASSDTNIGTIPAEPNNTAKKIFDGINTSYSITNGDNLYGVGEAVPCRREKEKYIGNLPRKLEKALRLAENYELIRLDLVPEGGLGTIWTGMNLDLNNWEDSQRRRTGDRKKEIFDDNIYIRGILDKHVFDTDSDGLLSQRNGSSSEASDLYESVAGVFNQFCQYTRKDCLQICDPLRYIFVQGPGEIKVMDDDTKNFSQHIYWPLKNQFSGMNTSYACTYANWFKINDTIGDRLVWAPPSGYVAGLMVRTDVNFFPWYATAGLTRGIINGIVDIGINPTQKQRDLLYKIGINPVVYWPGDGYVIWGQKTLQSKPSAFDRINVRRLFLWAEKAVLQIARFFVFEQNTPFTRSRLKAAIDPVLSYARSNEGIYDYMVVCDERNNTPDVIDRNELVVDIYIKPVRVAEFILVNFVATRTGQNFEELI